MESRGKPPIVSIYHRNSMRNASTPPANLTLGLVQMKCSVNRQENMDKAVAMIREATNRGADVVCLPELFQDLYPAQTRATDTASKDRFASTAEEFPGPTTKILSEIARQCGIVLVGGSFVERGDNGDIYNTAPLLSETGELLGKHRKLHIPHYPLYWEGAYFTPGNLGVQAFQTRVGKIAMGICFDQWHPQMGQLAGLQGADLMLFPTAIGMKPTSSLPDQGSFDTAHWPDMWVNAHRAQAVPNMIAVGAANRVGDEGELRFFGNSPIIDYTGRNIVEPQRDEEVVTLGEINLQQMRAERDTWKLSAHTRQDLLSQIAASTALVQEKGSNGL